MGAHLGVQDVMVDCLANPQILQVTLRASKTDPFRAGVDVFVGRTNCPLFPVAAVLSYTVKNGVFQNSCLGCLNVHSSTIPNRTFLKLPFEGVTGHPQNTLTSGSESRKGL